MPSQFPNFLQTLSNSVLQERLDHLLELQNHTPENPYSILHRLALAKAYKDLGYPDLAAGDAYKALLLVDEIAEEGEYYDEALEATISDYQEQNNCSETDEELAISHAKSSWLSNA